MNILQTKQASGPKQTHPRTTVGTREMDLRATEALFHPALPIILSGSEAVLAVTA